MSANILYKDNQVTIYDEAMVINKYYFPLATSKTVLFKDIAQLQMHDSKGVEHRWGICGKYLNNWFPIDIDRKLKNKFIEIVLKGKKTKPSITPKNPERVFAILWEKLTPEGRAAVEERKLKDGEQTEMAQEEMRRAEEEEDTTAGVAAEPAVAP